MFPFMMSSRRHHDRRNQSFSDQTSLPLPPRSLLLLLGGPGPGNIFVAPGPPGEAQEGHAAAGRVLGPAEEGPGENLPEAEVHQQTRPEETGRETGPEGLTGNRTRTRTTS